MKMLPLVPAADPQAPFLYRDGRTVSRADFLAQALSLARALPAHPRVLNMCADRYWFAVALLAAIVRDMLTVLPSSAAPEHIALVAAEQPDALVLGDQEHSPVEGLPYFRVSDVPAEAYGEAAPLIPFERRVACMYTSGSTGAPTRHFKTFGRLQLAIAAGAQRVWQSAGGACSVIGTSPIRHMYGLESSVLLPIWAGGRLSPTTPLFPADIAAALADMPAPRLLVITPFHLRKLLEADLELPAIATVLSATAPLAVELAREASDKLGCPVLEIYGSTETGQVATRETCADSVWHLLDGYALAQRDGETWAEGEVYETPQMINDVVELLDNARFRLVDRKANMLNVAGKRNTLTCLNAVITGLPGVIDAAFCVPERGENKEVERLAAFVVAPGVTRAAILDGLRQHVDPVFLPRPLVFVEALPRDGNGKIPARVLDALIAQHIPRN